MSKHLSPLLATRSHFSLGESTLKPAQIIEAVKTVGGSHVVCADTMNISSLIPITEACGEDLTPIIGTGLHIVDNPDERIKRDGFFQPKIFAKSEAGMRSIFSILSRAYEEDRFYYVPRLGIDEVLWEAAQGELVVTSGDMRSIFSHEDWEGILQRLLDALGDTDSFFVELVPLDSPYFDRCNARALEAIDRYNLRSIVSLPTLYADNKHAFVTNRAIINRGDRTMAFRIEQPQTDFAPVGMSDLVAMCRATKARLEKRYPSLDQGDIWRNSIGNVELFYDACAYRWEKQEISLPKLADDPNEAVKEACKVGLKKRLSGSVFGHTPTSTEVRDEYIPRLKYELQVLKDMDFSDYFLTVADLVVWAKKNDIAVGPGRGSVGGSLVAYLMGITDVDPLRFGLLFERFINPSRNDLPDADLDFQSTRREEVIDYLENQYGKERVAGISNYTELGSKSGMNDVFRVYGHDPFADTASKLVPLVHGQPVDLETAREQVGEIDIFATKYPEVWDDALALQGVMRSYGKHAAGVIVSEVPLIERGVVERRKDTRSVNWDMDVVEKTGLVKLDILGLTTLDTIGATLDYIEERHGHRPDLNEVSLDDEDVLAMFSRGDTQGIFQFEGAAARKIFRDMSATKNVEFNDVVATNALNRPGPIDAGLVDEYVNRRNGKVAITYPHPATEAALKETFGVIVYQEQVMRIAVDLCGFSLSDADKLRKAMGKKKPEEMAKWRDAFVDGADETSHMGEYEAGDLFDQIEKFAGYAFNKSHSVEYSLISYQLAWLKTHYPHEFYAGALSTVKEDKLQKIVESAGRDGIEVLPPQINSSGFNFVIDDKDRLVAPFSRVKAVATRAAKALMDEREKHGPYSGIEDVQNRVPGRVCNKRQIENLNLVGAFAEVEPGQLPATDLSRLRDQMVLMPGLSLRPVPASREVEKSRSTLLKLNDIASDYMKEDEHVRMIMGRSARIAFVADAPNSEEIKKGKFGYSRSHQVIHRALLDAGCNRNDAYWTGLLKRAKDTQLISAAEVKRYKPILDEELALTRPPVIVTLGSNAARYFVPDLKGSILDYAGHTFYHKDLDATIIIGINPGMVHFDPDKGVILQDAIETAVSLAI